MNSAILLSSLSLIAFSATAALLIVRRKLLDHISYTFLPLLISVLLYAGIVSSNLLEHCGVTFYFDPLEDLAEVVFTLVFLFFVYRWKRGRTEQRFRVLFKEAPIPLAEIDRKGHVLEVNTIMAEVFKKDYGIEPGEKTTLESWWERAFPYERERRSMMAAWRQTADETRRTETIISLGERVLTGRDGRKKTVMMGVSLINGNLLLSMVDITDRKEAEAEREKLQGQLLQAQKLEAIGVLAGGVAHDFNNNLGAIIGYAELCLEDIPKGAPFREYMEAILDAALRSSRLTRQLLIFSRKQNTAAVIVDLNASIESMLKMLRRLIGENISLTWLPWADSPFKVKIDPTHLDQILVNLCVNARDAIANVGRITIQTSPIQFDEDSCMAYIDCNPGEYVMISVSDTGCGMNKEIAQHVFEPFFTTKGVGKGTGLGLSTVYGIVRQSGGFISLYSEEKVGSTFNIYLPLQEVEKAPDSKTEAQIPHGDGETILLVEDDPAMLDMSRSLLGVLGYRVLAAPSPSEALRMIEEYGETIALVLTDVIMPEMNGRELIDRIREMNPEVKHVFMSGYTADIILHQGVMEGNAHFIQKPFSKRDIAFKIREAMHH